MISKDMPMPIMSVLGIFGVATVRMGRDGQKWAQTVRTHFCVGTLPLKNQPLYIGCLVFLCTDSSPE